MVAHHIFIYANKYLVTLIFIKRKRTRFPGADHTPASLFIENIPGLISFFAVLQYSTQYILRFVY